jgi:hypothetical protein
MPEDTPNFRQIPPHNIRQKPSIAERRRRLDIVESLVIDCASIPEILRYFVEKEGLRFGRRTVERYVCFVEKRIQKAGESKRQLEIQKAKRRFERCFARAMSGNKKNILAAIAAQKSINSLLGLNAPKEEEEMSPDHLAELILRQRNEMELTRKRPDGIKHEILQLFYRYAVIGQDSNELIQEVLQMIQPATEQPQIDNTPDEKRA